MHGPSAGQAGLLALALLVAAAGQGGGVSAAEAEITNVQVGFDGRYKVGYWTPVWITLAAGDQALQGRLQLTTADGDGIQVIYQNARSEVHLPPGKTARVLSYVKFGRLKSGLTIDVVAPDGGRVTRVLRHVLQPGELDAPGVADRWLVVTLGPGIGAAGSRRSGNAARDMLVAQIEDAGELPDQWFGYESVDRLILTTFDNPLLAQIEDSRFDALDQWVQLGGRLIMVMGEKGAELGSAAPAPGIARLRRFLPGQFDSVTTLRNASSLESFTGSSQALKLGARGVAVTTLSETEGRVELSEKGVRGLQPLIVTSAYGLGQVVFVAFDLDQPPFDTWEGRPRLLARLLRGDVGAGDSLADEQQRGRVTHVGYTDLSGQLRSALDQFTGIPLVPFYWVAGLIFIYILLIGPGDYLFLTRIARRTPWTWVTFPLTAVGFSVLAVLLSQQLKVDQLRINQVDLLDVDLASGQLRGTTWTDVYSPQTETYDLDWSFAEPLRQVTVEPIQSVFSWQGLPGTGLGGLNTTAAPPSFTDPYTLAVSRSRLIGTPIQVASTKSFQGRWWGRVESPAAGQLRENADGLLVGEIANPLPVPLTDCIVLYANWAYRLESNFGQLEPGEALQIERERPLNLEWRLTRRRVENQRDISTPWNENNLDVPRIMEIMMFHTAAGGDRYTELTHRYQGYTDLSFHLKRRRAVLLGRTTLRATQMEIDGQSAGDQYDQRWTFCRAVFPVQPWSSAANSRSVSAGE